jgi:hypothetical protein
MHELGEHPIVILVEVDLVALDRGRPVRSAR